MERIIIDSFGTLDSLVGPRRAIALVDENVARLYALPFEHVAVPSGEASKTLGTVEILLQRLIALGADRQTFLLGIGGGVTTDIAGFVASIYMRGVAYGLVPTTLLGQVDAAIGGKNGVNIGGFKNMAGRFGEPEFVLCDVAFLDTLPERDMRSGMAEVVKAAIVGDAELFDMLERGDGDLREIVRRAVAVKTAIVGRDRHESGERRLLNLGHTTGHAIEKVAPGRYLHGEAVSIGMVAAAQMAVARGMLSDADAVRIEALLATLGLPTDTNLDPATLHEAMRVDKKAAAGAIRFVLPTKIGECTIVEG